MRDLACDARYHPLELLALLFGPWTRPLEVAFEFRLADFFNPALQLSHHGAPVQRTEPGAKRFDLLFDYLLGQYRLAAPFLEIGVHHRAQIVDVIVEDVIDS